MHKLAVGIPEAAEMIGLGRSSLYALFRQGKLSPRKSGKRTLILIEDLESYLKSLPMAA
jgi:excisionase family DNA binding protein